MCTSISTMHEAKFWYRSQIHKRFAYISNRNKSTANLKSLAVPRFFFGPRSHLFMATIELVNTRRTRHIVEQHTFLGNFLRHSNSKWPFSREEVELYQERLNFVLVCARSFYLLLHHGTHIHIYCLWYSNHSCIEIKTTIKIKDTINNTTWIIVLLNDDRII